MADTFEELCARLLEQVDMIELLEVLSITPECIVDRFEDRIMIERDNIEEYLADE